MFYTEQKYLGLLGYHKWLGWVAEQALKSYFYLPDKITLPRPPVHPVDVVLVDAHCM